MYLTLVYYLFLSQLCIKAKQRLYTSSLAWYQWPLRKSFFFPCKYCLYCLMFYIHIHKCHNLTIRYCAVHPLTLFYWLVCQNTTSVVLWKINFANILEKHRLLSLKRFVKLKCGCDQVYKCFQLTPPCSTRLLLQSPNQGPSYKTWDPSCIKGDCYIPLLSIGESWKNIVRSFNSIIIFLSIIAKSLSINTK